MSRNEIILEHVRKDGCGLEIGPSHSPIASKKAGYNVHVLDFQDQQQLVERYRQHNNLTQDQLNSIEEVDFVWNGESYLELTGNAHHYDWVIASHVIEHTTDLIGFLNDCDSILKSDGVLTLVVPDKRYCFDHFRPLTGLARIIDTHMNADSIHSAGEAAEYFLNVVSKGDLIAWTSETPGAYQLVHTLDEAITATKSVIEERAYLDVHAWCFTPTSFRLIIQDLFDLGHTGLREVSFHDTVGPEFYVTLGRQGRGLEAPRVEMLQTIQQELYAPQAHAQSNPAGVSWLGRAARKLAGALP